ncbi:MAG TPA: twin-arginine translocation signal domain-containing protein, partial [Planctomycetaceae bacterium]|nr:twin-arginine translocation signal domain-containing protein [Planctomycetaceae bacterium]
MTGTRRQFLKSSTAWAALGAATPYVFTANAEARHRPRSANDRPGIGAIGLRYQGSVITLKAQAHGD